MCYFLVASDWQTNSLLAMIFCGLLLQEDGSRNVSHAKRLSYRNRMKADLEEHVDKWVRKQTFSTVYKAATSAN